MTKSDLYQAMFPIYYISKVWGLLPVRFEKSGHGKYSGRLNFVEITYSICLLLVLICAEFWGLYREVRDGLANTTRMESQTDMAVACIDILAITTHAGVSIFGAPFRWNKIQCIMDRLVEVDEILGIVSVKKTRRFSINILCGSLICLIVLSIGDYCVWNQKTKESNKMSDKGQINYVPLYFLYVTIVLMGDQIALASYSLSERFARLNKTLENLLATLTLNDPTSDNYREHGQFKTAIRGSMKCERLFQSRRRISVIELMKNMKPNSIEMIHDLLKVHSLLSDTALLINNAFGLSILIIVVTCLLHLVVTPYFFILGIYKGSEISFLAAELIWCIGHFGRLLIIVQPCYAATVQAQKTAILVSKILAVNTEQNVRKQLEIFSLQLLHRPLEFSACGLCSLNRSLITSIIGTTTTYLVILIQFQHEDIKQN